MLQFRIVSGYQVPVTKKAFNKEEDYRMYKRVTSMILMVAMVTMMLTGLSMVDAADTNAADQYVSVTSPPYKATGNGKTDDTAAIQAALSSGKNIYFPDGTYLVDAVKGLKPVSNQKIYLSSKAVIKAKPNSAGSYSIFNIYDRQNVRIEGGAVQGDRYSHTGTTGEWGYGISIRGSKDIVIKYVTVKDCWGDGIYVGKSNSSSENVQIINSVSTGNLSNGIKVDMSPNNLVEGNTLKGNGTYGVWVNNTDNVTVKGNQITENKWHGIRVLQSRNCTITKNTLTANGQAGNNAYDNISLEYNSDSNVVQENTCRMGTLANKSRYGVNIAVSTDDNNQVLYNDLVNSGVSGDLRDAGAGTVLTGTN
jgi:parallel beta-helix repeat protein